MPYNVYKKCTHCKKNLPLSSFSVDSSKKDKLSHWCRTCIKAKNTRYKRELSIRDKIEIPEKKHCPRCGKTKLSSEFSYSRHQKDGLVCQCKECKREIELLRKYKISSEVWEKYFKNQGGKCAICGKAEATKNGFVVDHNHLTGEIRELLCSRCNSILGMALESPEILSQAALYLEKWKDNP